MVFADLEKIRSKMENIGYRFVGQNKHSAVKICEWCSKSMTDKGHCYKQKFYGIDSARCVQMSPAALACTQNCMFCWRTLRFSQEAQWKWDEPSDIIEGCINAQKEILQGFGGNEKTTRKKFYEAMHPKNFAISLSGEAMLYPMIGQFLEELSNRKLSSFLVTNGTIPEKVRELLEKDQQPTQMYMTLAAPSKGVFNQTSLPIEENAWEKLQESLSLLSQFRRSVIRLTLVKDLNFVNPEEYAQIIEQAAPDYLEVKSFMSVGGARERIPYEKMPLFSDIQEFAAVIEKSSSYKIIDSKSDSRVVLMTRNAKPKQLISF